MPTPELCLAELPVGPCQSITKWLALNSRTAVRAATRSFGTLPTDELLQGLCVPLSELDLDNQPSRAARLLHMTCLTRLHLKEGINPQHGAQPSPAAAAAAGPVTAAGLTGPGLQLGDLATTPALATGDICGTGGGAAASGDGGEENEESRETERRPLQPWQLFMQQMQQKEQQKAQSQQPSQERQQQQVVLLLSRHVPLMPRLTTLTLDGLHVDSVVAAASLLPSCPVTILSLSNVRLGQQPVLNTFAASFDSLWGAPSSSATAAAAAPPPAPAASKWDGVWAALAGASQLRKLTLDQQGWATPHFRNLSQVKQLDSLTVKGTVADGGPGNVGGPVVCDLQALVGLTELDILVFVPDTANTRMNAALGLFNEQPTVTVAGVAALSRLCSLRIGGGALDDWLCAGNLVDQPMRRAFSSKPGPDPAAPHLTALTRLSLPDPVQIHQLTSAVLTCPFWAATLVDLEVAGNVGVALLSTAQCLTRLTCIGLYTAPRGAGMLPNLRHVACQAVLIAGRDHVTIAEAFPALETLQLHPQQPISVADQALVACAFPLDPQHAPRKLRTLTFVRENQEQLNYLTAVLRCPFPALDSFQVVSNRQRHSHQAILAELQREGGLGPRLRSVKLCPLDDADLAGVVAACPSLTSLELTRAGSGGEAAKCGVTDAGIASLAAAVHLRDVSVRHCPLVTSAGVTSLAAGCCAVQRIRVMGCPLVVAADAHRVPELARRSWLQVDVIEEQDEECEESG